MSRSQVAGLDATSALTQLVHETYQGAVKEGVKVYSPTAQLFEDLPDGGWDLRGQKLVGATDLTFGSGAVFTDGNLPDAVIDEPVNWETTPSRAYVRGAIDHFTQARAAGGAQNVFEDYGERIHRRMWEALKRLHVRAAVGDSRGIVAVVNSRSSSTVFTVKDGYGHVGTDPLMHLQVGDVIAWYDQTSTAGIDGAAIITAIDPSSNQITVGSGSTWEPGDTLASGDYIVFATTDDITASHFATGYNNGVSGLADIIDPDANNSTAFGIAESSNPRWKPYREASSTFDHIEATEHWRKLGARSTMPVTPQSHVVLTSHNVESELARSLDGYQQQANLGRTFEGGWQAVRIAGQDILADPYAFHDVMQTVCVEDVYNVPLDGEADYYSEDGSIYSRLADFDGAEWFIRLYFQYVTNCRNRHGALTGISTPSSSATDYTPAAR